MAVQEVADFIKDMGMELRVDNQQIHIVKHTIVSACGMPEPDSLKMTIETLRETFPGMSLKWTQVDEASCVLECA